VLCAGRIAHVSQSAPIDAAELERAYLTAGEARP
jgi:hypothetical protein